MLNEPDRQRRADDSLRSQQARIAVHTSWANTTDRAARTAAGTKAFLARFERQVDPDGTLPANVRRQMAESAKKAYFAKLAYQSAKARRGKNITEILPAKRNRKATTEEHANQSAAN